MRQLFSIFLGISLCIPVTLLVGETTSFDRATIREVVNQVEIVDPETLTGSLVEEGDLLRSPNILETGRRSRAELSLRDDTIIRVGSNSAFSFPEEGRQLNLNEGSVLLHSPSGRGGGSIVTSSATASVVGTTFIVVATSDGGFKIMVLEGQGKVTFPNGEEQNLQPGQMMFVLPGSTGVKVDRDGRTGTVQVVAGEPGPVLDFDLERQSTNALLLQGFSRGLPSWGNVETEIRGQLRRIEERGLRRTNRLIIGAINREFVYTYETENRPNRSDNRRDRRETVEDGRESEELDDTVEEPERNIPRIEGDPFVLTSDHLFTLNPRLTLDGRFIGEGVLYRSARDGSFSSFAFVESGTSGFFNDRIDSFFNENEQEHAVFGFQSLFVDGFSLEAFADRGLVLFSEGDTTVHLGAATEGSSIMDLPGGLPSLALVTEDGRLSVINSDILASTDVPLIETALLLAAGGPNGDLDIENSFFRARDHKITADQSLTILTSEIFAESITDFFFGDIEGPQYEGGGEIIIGPEIDQLIPLDINIFSNAGPILIEDSAFFASEMEFMSGSSGEYDGGGGVLGEGEGEGFFPFRPIGPSGAAPQYGQIVVFSESGSVTMKNTDLVATGGQLVELMEDDMVPVDSQSGRIDIIGQTLDLDGVFSVSQGDSGIMFLAVGRDGATIRNSNFLLETPSEWILGEGDGSIPNGVLSAAGGALYFGDSAFEMEDVLDGFLTLTSGEMTHLSNAFVSTGEDSGTVTVRADSGGTVLIDGVGSGAVSGGMTRITAREIELNGQIIGIREGVLTGKEISIDARPMNSPDSEIRTGRTSADFGNTRIGTANTTSISMDARTIILENTHLFSDGDPGSISLISENGLLNDNGNIVVGSVNYVGDVRYTGGTFSDVPAVDATWAELNGKGDEGLPIHVIQRSVD
ncbi:MAG: FecR domain-containing protein [Opitutales bacterium]|nr:FecR domain-containing protein [Opitutales bacterium]MCH8539169.1 FecR family protein [Opitutales bacterium]